MKCTILLFIGSALILVGCATTSTRIASVSPQLVKEEQEIERQMVLAELAKQQWRLDSLIFPLISSSTELCSTETKYYWGIRYDNLYGHDGDWREAAEKLGLTDTLVITRVVPGSPAQAAGLQAGDRILSLNDRIVPVGKKALDETPKLLDNAGKNGGKLDFLIRRDADTVRYSVQGMRVCRFAWIVTVEGGINAFADGDNIIIPWAMMRFAQDDELRVVLAHELAHNIMGHIKAKKQNALLGGIFGALGDISLAAMGYNSHGSYTNMGSNAGASAFSQDFEREADYVGMYILARAEIPLDNAPNLWRKFAQIDPKAIGYASTHPTTAERFILLEQTAQEINTKRANGSLLFPEMKKKK